MPRELSYFENQIKKDELKINESETLIESNLARLSSFIEVLRRSNCLSPNIINELQEINDEATNNFAKLTSLINKNLILNSNNLLQHVKDLPGELSNEKTQVQNSENRNTNVASFPNNEIVDRRIDEENIEMGVLETHSSIEEQKGLEILKNLKDYMKKSNLRLSTILNINYEHFKAFVRRNKLPWDSSTKREMLAKIDDFLKSKETIMDELNNRSSSDINESASFRSFKEFKKSKIKCLDTAAIIRETLKYMQDHDISRKYLAEKVLDITHERLGELLKRPPKWNKIQKVKTINAFVKLRRFLKMNNEEISVSDEPDQHEIELKILLSDKQVAELNKAFNLQRNPDDEAVKNLSQKLALRQKFIENWFISKNKSLK